MDNITLVIGVVRKDQQILLRRKPDGVGPYQEPWYLFGGKIDLAAQTPEEVIEATILEQTGLVVKTTERVFWDTETKPDEADTVNAYLYLDVTCEYVSGELTPGPGIFQLEWVNIDQLDAYQLNPPSVKLLSRLGLMKPSGRD